MTNNNNNNKNHNHNHHRTSTTAYSADMYDLLSMNNNNTNDDFANIPKMNINSQDFKN
jgi:hypothetical protein